MLDQSFSAKNFRRIFDIENRKGVYLEGQFFPELEPLTNKLRENAAGLREAYRQKINDPGNEPLWERIKNLYDKKWELKNKKDTRILKSLEQASEAIGAKGFSLGVRKGVSANGKDTYTTDGSAAAFFALKQLQRNIRVLFKVRQSNRHHIVCQLREVLNDHFPKVVYKIDFRGFYENIPRDRLLKQIIDDPLLTLTSKNIIKRTLR